MATPPLIQEGDLPAYLKASGETSQSGGWESLPYKEAKDMVLEAFEREYLKYHLKQNEWNISRTAEFCQIDRRTIHRLINKFNLKRSGSADDQDVT